jgi:hypothetical protein
MLAERDVIFRLAAGVALLAIGEVERALPVVERALGEVPVETAIPALPWIPTARRREVFEQLMTREPSSEAVAQLTQVLVAAPDDASAELLWRLVDTSTSAAAVQPVHTALLRVYFGDHYYDVSRAGAAAKKRAARAAKEKAAAGPELRRTVALALLMSVDSGEALAVARALLGESSVSAELRRDAQQVVLAVAPEAEARQIASSALRDESDEMRRIAVKYFALGPESLRQLRGGFYMGGTTSTVFSSTNKPDLKPPAGLTRELLDGVRSDGDPETVAYVAYLRALLGDNEALPGLIQHWRGAGQSDPKWKRLVYRAIAALNDDSQAPVLEEIYKSYQRYEVREMYWTIRDMNGPAVVALRKKIRQEVGMEYLR